MGTPVWVRQLRNELGLQPRTPDVRKAKLTKVRALTALDVAAKVASSPILREDLNTLAALIRGKE